MTFEVEASEIASLNPIELVQLLRKLLYAEVGWYDIKESGVSVPLQINFLMVVKME